MLPDDILVSIKNLEKRIDVLERASQGALYRYGPLGIPSSLIAPSAAMNWSFDSGLDYWEPVGDPSKLSIDNTKAYGGAASLKVAPTSAPVGVRQTVNVGRSSDVRVLVKLYQDAYEPNGTMVVTIDQLDKNEAVVKTTSNSFVLVSGAGNLNVPYNHFVPRTLIPNGVVSVRVAVTIQGTSGAVYLDQIYILMNGGVTADDVGTVVYDETGRNGGIVGGKIYVTFQNSRAAGTQLVLPSVGFGYNFFQMPVVLCGVGYGSGTGAITAYATDVSPTGFTPVLYFHQSAPAGSGTTVQWAAYLPGVAVETTVNI